MTSAPAYARVARNSNPRDLHERIVAAGRDGGLVSGSGVAYRQALPPGLLAGRRRASGPQGRTATQASALGPPDNDETPGASRGFVTLRD